MNRELLDKIIEEFIEFSLNEKEALYKILIILIFLLFIVRKNNKTTKISKTRKKQLNEAFEYIDTKLVHRNKYAIPEIVEKNLLQRGYNKTSISMLVADIMKHMGLPDKLPAITVYDVSGCNIESPGRCYMYGDGTSSLTFNLIPEYDIDIVASIVIHECMHHYLNVKRMVFKDKEKNEIVTDICAIYSGFGDILYKGYRARAVQYRKENKEHRLGYLSQSEIRYIMKKIG